MRLNHGVLRSITAGLAAALVLTLLAPLAPLGLGRAAPVKIRAAEAIHDVDGAYDFALPSGTTHVALHWPGHADAAVRVAFSADGATFSQPAEVEIDEVGASRGRGETYGVVMSVGGGRVARVTTDRPVAHVSVLTLDAAGQVAAPLGLGAQADAAGGMPAVIPRSAWGADETLRFDALGQERFERTYFPLQKLVVHHTAGRNADPNPAATIRAIYYYHAVTQGCGDIGYQYLIDEAGRVYEGRFSRDYWNGALPSADNDAGLIVRAANVKDHNPGILGVGLLGTFTSQAPTAAARASLVRLLTWIAMAHGLAPNASSPYVHPLTGETLLTPNIAGHRDYNPTACPGGVLYGLLPTIRRDVGLAMAGWGGQVFNPARRLSFAKGTYIGRRFNGTGAITASKRFTLSRSSSAPTNQRSIIPHRVGNWYYITAGVWAGYWIPESARTLLGPAPPSVVVESYDPSRPLLLAPGSYVGRRFNASGAIVASSTYTVTADTMAWTYERSTIPAQAGSWYHVTAGPLFGYWVVEGPGVTLGDPPPPAPAPIETYDPPQKLWFAPGTYQGLQFNAYGMVLASTPFTTSARDSALVIVKSTIVAQSGNWYLVGSGPLAGYWVAEEPGLWLGGP